MNDAEQRPLYILGSGFSKALNTGMPITDELGNEVAKLFKERKKRECGYKHDESFEDWLSTASQEMPYLDSPDNRQRTADLQLVLSLIATVLEKCSQSLKTVPYWAEALIKRWSQEQARIITFNYDVLLEKSINEVQPNIQLDCKDYQLHGDELVFPRPQTDYAGTWNDSIPRSAKEGSMQIMKLHGSLNWYWAPDDQIGPTLRRIPVLKALGNPDVDVNHSTSGLERFLIPPLSGKSAYYRPYLTRALWSDALAAVRHAESITFMGYSLPMTDRVTVELLKMSQSPRYVNIVDLNANAQKEDSLRNRIEKTTKCPDIRTFSGKACMERFVNRSPDTEHEEQTTTPTDGRQSFKSCFIKIRKDDPNK